MEGQGEGHLEAPLVLSKGGWTELRSPKQRHQARRRGRRLEHHGQQEAYERKISALPVENESGQPDRHSRQRSAIRCGRGNLLRRPQSTAPKLPDVRPMRLGLRFNWCRMKNPHLEALLESQFIGKTRQDFTSVL